ncbi:MAG: DUF3568 family protein [Verrucomicrobiales bacterium]|nr:DUF3568 family protein [Verrucomicrobiales bacterium]
MNHRRFPAIAISVILAVAPTGCGTRPTADSPPGMHYSAGSLMAVESAPMGRVWRASRAALSDLDITELEAQGSALAAYIDGRTPDLKKVSVKMRPLSTTKTELKIRIDTFGDESLARLIYEKIQIALAP